MSRISKVEVEHFGVGLERLSHLRRRGGRWRPGALFALAALLACPTQTSSVAAATANSSSRNDQWALSLPTFTIHRGGASFHVQLLVTESTVQEEAGPERNQVIYAQVISHTHGRTASGTQQAVFTFDIDRTRDRGFTHRTDLSRATVTANDYLAGQLRMKISFKSTSSSPSSECQGHTQTSAGSLAGTLWFRPKHSHIGSIQKLPTKAHLIHADGTCPAATPPEPRFTAGPHCTASETFAAGQTLPNNRLYFDVRKDSNTSTAVARAWSSNINAPYVWRVIHAQFPAKDVSIAPDLGSIALHFPAGTYFTGDATATTDGAPMAWPEAGGCPSSGPASTSVYRRGGDYSGTLSVDYFFGSRPSVGTQSVAATAASNAYPASG